MSGTSKRDYDKAIADYNEAIRLDPTFAGVCQQGRCLAGQGDYHKSELAASFYNQGIALQSKEEYEKAVDAYSKAIQLVPVFPAFYLNRGNRMDSQERTTIRPLPILTRRYGSAPRCHRLQQPRLCLVCSRLTYDQAIADFTKAIRLDPRFVVAFTNRGDAWKAKKNYDKAIADFNEAIRLDPRDAVGLRQTGQRLAGQEGFRQGHRRLHTRPSGSTPTYALAYYNRGNSWLSKKEYDKAIADYNEAIRVDPKFAHAYINRGFCLGGQERLRQGHRRLQRVDPARS